MHLNIAQKIYGIAIVVLTLMVSVAAFSIHLTAGISNELETVAGKHLPLSETIGRINVRILEQGLLVQRLFVLSEDSPLAIARIKALSDDVNVQFVNAHKLFKMEEQSSNPPATIILLERSLSSVEREYRTFKTHSFQLLSLHQAGDVNAFESLLPDLNKQQDAIDAEIDNLHRHVETLADQAVWRADNDEKFLLLVNTGLTMLAAVLGLGLAAVITFSLVRNVRNLVRGAEAVEAGELNTEVAVMSRDEVGQLTGSFNNMVQGLRMKELVKDTFG